MMKSTTVAWLMMVIAVIGSYACGESGMAARIEVLAVALLAAFKAFLIINYFMELK